MAVLHLSLLRVAVACRCCMSLLRVAVACRCCMSLLRVAVAWRCCVAASSCWQSDLGADLRVSAQQRGLHPAQSIAVVVL